MYNIIFGESIFNDAVSMVAYEIVKHFKGDTFGVSNFFEVIGRLLLGLGVSCIMGYFLGFLTALLIKYLNKCFKNSMEYIEIAILLAIPWISYLSAHILGLSGILCIFFNGLSQAIYTKPLMTKGSLLVNNFI
jgi:solute carrier family 9 (sodium/hydrogen exchanger), member 6/7